MRVKILPSQLNGQIIIPSSKSVAHRAMISAFLSDKPCTFLGNFDVGDIKTTLDCLKQLGANFNCDNLYAVEYLGNRNIDFANINVLDSGSTLRFLLSVIAAKGIKASIEGSKRLANRPIGELLEVLKANGESFSNDTLPFEMNGKLTSFEFEITGSVSSQYLTGLLLATPILAENSKIIIKGEIVSKDYLAITESVLHDFSIAFEKHDYGYLVFGNQTYLPPKNYVVEGDWSSGCFFLFMGALSKNGKVIVKGLKESSKQGDKIVLKLLQQIGAKVDVCNDEVKVSKGELNCIDFDALDYPDIVPSLAATLAFCNGVSVIKNVERLRQKESDRISETIRMLESFNVKATYDGCEFKIYGGTVSCGNYVAPNDHRMAMAATIIAINAKGESQIDGAECVKKSYPNFFLDLAKIGGKINV